MTLRSILVPVLCLVIVACKKDPAKMSHAEKVKTLPAKMQPLFKSWKLDVNESAKLSSKLQEETTGIKADIKFDGDVGDAMQFAARSLYFTFDTKSMRTAYEETYGEGLLSTSSAGWLTVDKDATEIVLAYSDGKETAYAIEELTDDRLVIAPKEGGAREVYTAK